MAPSGALPSGCAVAIGMDPAALGPAIEVLGGLIKAVARTNGAVFGIEPKTHLRRIAACKMPGRATRGHPGRYVILMSGRIPLELVESAVADQRRGFRRETLAGLPIAGGPTSWIARRGSSSAGADASAGELVMASDRELLRETLVGPQNSYRLDPDAPFSAVIAGQELRAILATQQGAGDTGLDRIQEVAVTVPPGARVVRIRAFVGDALVSEKLARSLKPLLSNVAASLVGPDRSPPEVTTTVDAGDLILHAELADGSWDAIAARLLPGKVSGRPLPLSGLTTPFR
ncbi:MAG: hypothetical protein ABIS92_18365 [Polyangia bacterium]